ncbi:pro-sigmaK processing inhibitor BofA family protein [Halalkalibacter urbisdiaboli]|uniref:pro-sigmaK processing inhibitor BofA family protein n=1 Tax=Halalkalibacter urbisdiaboli TaxID=1960589 RepID=UPI000B444B37|nr:pro-sigmaK processing inhibitor BofA family protein [Halalkalibacter urbisdiaboli]
MDPIVIVMLLGGLILMLLIVGAPIKPIRFIGNIGVKLIVGCLLLFFVNAFGSFIDFHIPINGVTAAVSGLLGIPGVALLIVVKFFIL